MATFATSNGTPAAESLMGLLGALRRYCEAREAEIRDRAGLTEAQFAFLRAVPPEGTVRTGDLARQGGLSPSRGGRVVEELVQAGLLRRVDGPGDRRVQSLALTARGRDLRRRLDGALRQCDEALRGRLPAGQADRVLEGLRTLAGVLEP